MISGIQAIKLRKYLMYSRIDIISWRITVSSLKSLCWSTFWTHQANSSRSWRNNDYLWHRYDSLQIWSFQLWNHVRSLRRFSDGNRFDLFLGFLCFLGLVLTFFLWFPERGFVIDPLLVLSVGDDVRAFKFPGGEQGQVIVVLVGFIVLALESQSFFLRRVADSGLG